MKEQGAVLRRIGERLVVTKEREVLEDILIIHVDQVVVMGNVQHHLLLIQADGQAVRQAAGEIEQARRRARGARSLDSLRGHEGAGGAAYFRALQSLIPPEWGFVKRLYHPPPDPVNALLSLGYTLLLKDTIAAVQLVGLDPYLGFFHSLDYGRPSLALDLMEPFRPVIDGIVLTMIESKRIRRKDFLEEDRGSGRAVLLDEPALRRYLQAYEAQMIRRVRYSGTGEQTTRRRCLELQARELAQVVLGKRKQFEPFLME